MPIAPPASHRHAWIDAALLQNWLLDGQEIALIDVREHGLYGEGHPFLAVHAAYSRLELEVPRLVPRRATRVVLFDDGDNALASRAARRMAALGYSAVHLLDGGASAWERSGRVLFKGVNVPSKTFGERVEAVFDVPHIKAAALADRLRHGLPVFLLDGRTLEEHRVMTIPGAVPVPNGELALRWRSVVTDAVTPVVVHCAGRTRSLVGAQILRDLGVPNPVLALEDGTQGWAIAGLELERGSTRCLPPLPAGGARDAARADAWAFARRAGVAWLDRSTAQAWLDDASRTTFVIDVRTREEFDARSLPGARHVPGGQLLQAGDLEIGVRGARVLLIDDDDSVRASVIATWLHRLGVEAALVQGGVDSALRVPEPSPSPALPALERVPADRLAPWRGNAVRVDLRASSAYRRRHARAALWSIRPRVVADVDAYARGDREQPVLLIAADEAIATLAALDLREAGWQRLGWTTADALEAASWPQESTPQSPTDAEAIDFLLFVHDRHQGNLDAARRYLAWEHGLICQCRPDELAVFRV